MELYAKIIDEQTKKCKVINQNESKKMGLNKYELELAYDGNWYIKGYAPQQPIEDIKNIKILQLKAERDKIQELPIEYNGKSFDYNKESLQKLNEAKDALEGTEDKQIWICADNTLTYLTYNDIMAIKLLGKNRSNDAHIQYAKLKYLIESLTTKEEIEAIIFDTDTSEIILEV